MTFVLADTVVRFEPHQHLLYICKEFAVREDFVQMNRYTTTTTCPCEQWTTYTGKMALRVSVNGLPTS